MKNYRSVTRCSANENGQEEVTLESNWPFWKHMWMALTDPCGPTTNIESYVFDGRNWLDKKTGEQVSVDIGVEISRCVAWVTYHDKFWN